MESGTLLSQFLCTLEFMLHIHLNTAKCRCLQEWQVHFRILAAKYQQHWHPLTTVNFKEECKVVVLKTMHDFTLTQQHIFLTLKFHLTHSYQSNVWDFSSAFKVINSPKNDNSAVIYAFGTYFCFYPCKRILNYWKRTNTEKSKSHKKS